MRIATFTPQLQQSLCRTIIRMVSAEILPPAERKKTTILTLNNHKKKGIKTVGVTAYDYPQALLADKAGVDWILVGDSIGMTTLGYKTTIPVTMDDMLPHCTAVWRANQSCISSW